MALGHIPAFFSLLLFFTHALYAQTQDFQSCQLKYQISSIKINNTHAFAINDKYALLYTEKKPEYEVIKRDPFLGLTLINLPKRFKHTFKFYQHNPKGLAGVLPTSVSEGKFTSEQVGLNRLAQFSKPLEANAIVTGTCCGVVGLSTGNGVIEKEYIRHFLESKKLVYSDIGIRLADKNGVCVIEVNPFFVNSPFLLNDVILSMDGKKTSSAAGLSRRILFSQPKSEHVFVVLRGAKEHKIKAILKERLSGGLIPDSFFDLFGLELDENLIVKKDNPKFEIKKDDRLLLLMQKEVNTLADVRRLLSQEKTSDNEMIVLMFQRKGFDFFIHFDKPKNKKESMAMEKANVSSVN